MGKTSIRDRLEKLENHQRFLNWFVMARLFDILSDDELERYRRDGKLPDPLPQRPSPLDGVDRKTLTKQWEEAEQIFRGRSAEDLEYFTKTGFWPEQRGELLYSTEDGNLIAEWKIEQHEDSAGPVIES